MLCSLAGPSVVSVGVLAWVVLVEVVVGASVSSVVVPSEGLVAVERGGAAVVVRLIVVVAIVVELELMISVTGVTSSTDLVVASVELMSLIGTPSETSVVDTMMDVVLESELIGDSVVVDGDGNGNGDVVSARVEESSVVALVVELSGSRASRVVDSSAADVSVTEVSFGSRFAHLVVESGSDSADVLAVASLSCSSDCAERVVRLSWMKSATVAPGKLAVSATKLSLRAPGRICARVTGSRGLFATAKVSTNLGGLSSTRRFGVAATLALIATITVKSLIC